MKRKIKRMALWFFIIVAGYIVIGLVIHHWIMPVKKPDLTSYFKTGKTFTSKLEGIKQTVVKVDNESLICNLVIDSKAKGPLAHTHENFDEVFTVTKGTLSIRVGDEVKKITAGQTITIPKNTVHTPFNQTDSVVELTCRMPLSFAYCLSQLYPFWDAAVANTKPPKLLFQLALYGKQFDSYPVEDAPPKPVLKTLKFLLAPTARLLGYKYFDEQYGL